MFNSSRKNNVIMRVYQPTIPVDETKLPKMISGLMADIPTSHRQQAAKKSSSKKTED